MHFSFSFLLLLSSSFPVSTITRNHHKNNRKFLPPSPSILSQQQENTPLMPRVLSSNGVSIISPRGNGKPRKQTGPHLHSSMYSYLQEEDGCFNCVPGIVETNHPPSNSEPEVALPLVTVPPAEFSPDQLELPPKPFHHSNCSADSPCVSESGSDIFTKREVIHKLRQQLKRRDDMILEMQDQITEYQNSLNAQLEHSAHLQAQLEAANGDLFDSEREIQRLRKAIADHCMGSKETVHQSHSNGYVNGDQNGFDTLERIDMLKKEVGDLKEVIEGKEYLLQSYKEQKAELSLKIKELQNRLDSQLPNIL
ncbi:hypothetical protein CRG98_000221 [Punica granatum]|uniref:Uncharacterized protein n=1 Tax=Punica granatum TaxID=22663 RepID=A0A2I0LG38_PUNGR|nr:hypothetical protein CRG98_000221 [Punica granatum]